MGRPRDGNDRVAWLSERGRYAEALSVAEEDYTGVRALLWGPVLSGGLAARGRGTAPAVSPAPWSSRLQSPMGAPCLTVAPFHPQSSRLCGSRWESSSCKRWRLKAAGRRPQSSAPVCSRCAGLGVAHSCAVCVLCGSGLLSNSKRPARPLAGLVVAAAGARSVQPAASRFHGSSLA